MSTWTHECELAGRSVSILLGLECTTCHRRAIEDSEEARTERFETEAKRTLCPIGGPECCRRTVPGGEVWDELIEIPGVDPDRVRLDDGGQAWRAVVCSFCVVRPAVVWL